MSAEDLFKKYGYVSLGAQEGMQIVEKYYEAKLEELQKALEESKQYKVALRQIVCLNIPMPDEVFNIANDALERSNPWKR